MPTCSWSCASLLSNKGKQFIYSVEMFLRIFFPALLAGASVALPGPYGCCVLKGAGGRRHGAYPYATILAGVSCCLFSGGRLCKPRAYKSLRAFDGLRCARYGALLPTDGGKGPPSLHEEGIHKNIRIGESSRCGCSVRMFFGLRYCSTGLPTMRIIPHSDAIARMRSIHAGIPIDEKIIHTSDTPPTVSA